MNMPKFGCINNFLLGMTPREVCQHVHNMPRAELIFLHKAYEKTEPGGIIQQLQARSIARELRLRGYRKDHESMNSPFIKR